MKILMHLISTQIFDIDEKQLCRITRAATWEKKNARPDFPRVLVQVNPGPASSLPYLHSHHYFRSLNIKKRKTYQYISWHNFLNQ